MKAKTIIRKHRGPVFVEVTTGFDDMGEEDMVLIKVSKAEAIRVAGILEEKECGVYFVKASWGVLRMFANNGDPTEIVDAIEFETDPV